MKHLHYLLTIMDNKEVKLTKTYTFSASHRLHSPFIGEKENAAIYGKCGRTSGHGHNYRLKITIKGVVNSKTGVAGDINKLDDMVNKVIISPLDHKNLNMEIKDVPILTSEVLINEVWKRLKSSDQVPEICGIELEETEKNSFQFFG